MNIRSACLLLSVCQAGSAAALGLGEIEVRSPLGRPLHATVALLDAAADTTAECFSLDAVAGGVAPPLHAELSLARAGGQTLLHIRTARAVNDPVVQFALISNCEARLQREYVVLLDPPSLAPPVAVEAGPAAAHPAVPAAASPTPRPVRQAQPAAAARAPAVSARRARHAAVPRLVLSGRRSVAAGAGFPFALRMDTRLPGAVPPRPEGLTAIELSDENTALSRKLAHLETQLAALQRRNAELEAAQRAKAVPSAPPAPPHAVRWPLFLLLAGLLSSGIALLAWLLRRPRAARPSLLDDAAWTQPGVPAAPPEAPPRPAPMPERMPPSPAEGTEVKEDILDQAEVFMAHGHANLAIHLLQEHLRDAPTESPVPWLLLLDLLHREGDAAGYDAASAECRRYFNVNLSEPPVSQDNESGQGLEAYPHLLDELVRVWNSPERDAFFKDLIYDHRGGTRMGFKPAAYRDILLLRAIAQASPLAHAA